MSPNHSFFRLSIVVILLVSGTVSCQKPLYLRAHEVQQSLLVVQEDTVFTVRLYKGSKAPKMQPFSRYHWYKNNELHTTMGDYTGQLLHGEFMGMTKENELLIKGYFDKGLKEGTWKSWFPDGQYHELAEYDEGVLDGDYRKYTDSGRLLQEGKYKKGAFFGELYHYEHQQLDSVTIYKKGRVKKGRKIEWNPKKTDRKKDEEIVKKKGSSKGLFGVFKRNTPKDTTRVEDAY